MKASKKQRPYEFIEHTADFGIRVLGQSPQLVYINAAKAMFCAICRKNARIKKQAGTKRVSFQLDISAGNRAELLVAWLSELLSLFDIHALVFTRFKIRQLTYKKLLATAWGEPAGNKNYILKREIKAVTYHGLKFKKTAGFFCAEIIFDT